MTRASLMAMTVLLLSAGSASAQPGWCAGIDKAQVGSLLGAAVPAPLQAGPERDEDSGGVNTTCAFVASPKGVVAIRVEFASAAEARKHVSIEYLKNQQQNDEDVKYVEEKGIGDRAFWAVSDEGAFYAILQGARLYGVGLGGMDGKVAASKKPAILKLVQSLLGS